MGMNRKWNMRVFELHDPNGSPGGNTIPTPPTNDDVYIDTSTSSIIMSKYPFTAEGMLPEGADTSSILNINLSDLTQDPDFLSYFMDKDNWHFIEGDANKLNVQGNNQTMMYSSVVQAFLDLPTDAPRWVLKFDLHTNPSLYRSFFLFDGIDDTEHTATRYKYGMDIPSTGYPHLQHITDDTWEIIDNTIADEQYFTGETDMPVIVTRWDNTYTLYYDNRYMITIPTENDTLNRIGIWTWSGSNTYIKNPELYIIDDDSSASNVLINTQTTPNDDINIDTSIIYDFSMYDSFTDTMSVATGTCQFTGDMRNNLLEFTVISGSPSNVTNTIGWIVKDYIANGQTKNIYYTEDISAENQSYIILNPHGDVSPDETPNIDLKVGPFNPIDIIGDAPEANNLDEITINNLTKDDNFEQSIGDISNWIIPSGSQNFNLSTDNGILIETIGAVDAIFDIPSDSTRWLLEFTHRVGGASTSFNGGHEYIGFAGITNTETDVKYKYGWDVYHSHVRLVDTESTLGAFQETNCEGTRQNVDRFIETYHNKVYLSRWDDTYTLYYANKYMITVVAEEEYINRFIISASHTGMQIINPTFYILDTTSDADNVIVMDALDSSQGTTLELDDVFYDFNRYTSLRDETPIDTGILELVNHKANRYAFTITESSSNNTDDTIYWVLNPTPDGVTRMPVTSSEDGGFTEFYISYIKHE